MQKQREKKALEHPLKYTLREKLLLGLEPDVLEWEVKWALRSITTNKASGGEEFQLSYFKS